MVEEKEKDKEDNEDSNKLSTGWIIALILGSLGCLL